MAILRGAGLCETSPSSGTYVINGTLGSLRLALYTAFQARKWE